MANITTVEVGDSIPTIVAAEALGALKNNTVMTRLVARDWDDDIASFGDTVDIPFTGALSVNDKAANTVVTLQNPNDTKVSVVLDKHKEVSFLIEDIAEAFSRPDYLSAYTQDAVTVLAEQIDGDLTGLYVGLSQTVVGTAGIDAASFTESRRLLNSAKAPLSSRVAVLHEDAEAEYLGITEAVNADFKESLGAAAADSFVGRFMGFDVFMDQGIKVATTVVQNLLFHRNAFVIATRPLPPAPSNAGVQQTVMSEDGMGIRVTMSYSPDHLGVQLTIDVLYGVAELRDNHGVVLTSTEV